MSKRKTSFPSSDFGAESAEEFMAMLIAAQNTEHDCIWVQYFKKMGDEMVNKYVPKEG